MIRSGILAFLLAVSVATVPAQSGVHGGVHGGILVARFDAPLDEIFGVGFGGGLHIDLTPLSVLTFRVNGDYHTFPSDKGKLASLLAQGFSVGGNPAEASNITVTGFAVNTWSVSVSAIGRIPTGSIEPYAIAGVGYYTLSGTDASVNYQGIGDITVDLRNLGVIGTPETQHAAGVSVGGGLEFVLGTSRLFVEGRYVRILTDPVNEYLPITLGFIF